MNIDALQEYLDATSYNTAYTLRAYALALRDITPFGRNVVYAGTLYPEFQRCIGYNLKNSSVHWSLQKTKFCPFYSCFHHVAYKTRNDRL